MTDSINEKKEKLIKSALPFIAQQGWHKDALVQGAEKAGIAPGLIGYLFPEGALDAYTFFSDWIDDQLIEQMNKQPLADMPVHKKVEACLVYRLELMKPYRQALQQAHKLFFNSRNPFFAAKQPYKVADTIWHICGDTSMDYNYYTKRMTLGYVYASVVKRWLSMPQNYTTEAMKPVIQEKLQQVMKIGKFKQKARDFLQKFSFTS